MADWSVEEVEATVADYLDMLGHEVGGVPYSKTAHRIALKPRLDNRSPGAIERKHQNISAVLIRLGFTYIAGYKPLGNYQQLLYHIVADRLARRAALIQAVRRQVEAPADVPTVDDILATLVDPPAPTERAYRPKTAQEQRVPGAEVDYLAMEARNRSLGSAGEEFVVRFEAARLMPEHDHLYRAFDFRRRPRLFWKSGAIDQAFGLEPSQFVASVR
ncbi:MAG: hypothetical protein AB7G23_13680 [Vicinamibacterales bacterium]